MSNKIDNILENGSAENEQTYSVIRKSVITAQSKIYTTVNSAMVEAYWEIGEQFILPAAKMTARNTARVC